MKEITLTQGKVALVDDEDFEYLNKLKWYARKNKTTFYARARIGKRSYDKKIYMHRLILGLDDPKIQTDHKDHNGLNNQRNNLRIATYSQNNSNLSSHKNTSSKYKGVCLKAGLRKWTAAIYKNGKNRHLGYYETEEQAAREYDKHAKIIHGEFANLNFKEIG